MATLDVSGTKRQKQIEPIVCDMTQQIPDCKLMPYSISDMLQVLALLLTQWTNGFGIRFGYRLNFTDYDSNSYRFVISIKKK